MLLLSHLVILFCNLVDSSLPGPSIHGISQASILEWVAISFSRVSSWSRGQTRVSWLANRFFITEPPGKPLAQIEKICLIFYIRALYDREIMQIWLRASGKWHENSSLITKFWNVSVTSFHEMATHSSVLAWRIPGTGAWWAAVYGVAQSGTRLKQSSSSSSKICILTWFLLICFLSGREIFCAKAFPLVTAVLSIEIYSDPHL